MRQVSNGRTNENGGNTGIGTPPAIHRMDLHWLSGFLSRTALATSYPSHTPAPQTCHRKTKNWSSAGLEPVPGLVIGRVGGVGRSVEGKQKICPQSVLLLFSRSYLLVHQHQAPLKENGTIEAAWFARRSQDAHPPPRPTLGRQAVQEARPRHGLQVQPVRWCLARQGNRAGEDVREGSGCSGFIPFLCVSFGHPSIWLSPLPTLPPLPPLMSHLARSTLPRTLSHSHTHAHTRSPHSLTYLHHLHHHER